MTSYVTNAENYYIKYDKKLNRYRVYVIDPNREGVCHCNDCGCTTCDKGCLEPPESLLSYSLEALIQRIQRRIDGTALEEDCEG